MIIKNFSAKNFRTLEDIEIEFEPYYTAISGKNNSGKSNILKAIRLILGSGVFVSFLQGEIFGFGNIKYLNDYTNWKKEEEAIFLKLCLEIDKNDDASLFKFITEFVLKDKKENEGESNTILTIEMERSPEDDSRYKIFFGETEIEEEFPKREILRRIKTSDSIVFHNSTEMNNFPPFRQQRESISNFLEDSDKKSIQNKIKTVIAAVKKSLKKQQEELGELLGRLEEKYEVSLSIQGLNLDKESIDISLKEKGVDVSLDDWGSGTRNRTLIFLSLLNARKIKGRDDESEKITPIVVIEEPESFLHPSAQAEFGRILQGLAEELKIQVIVATHSPYLLSYKKSKSNILIDRNLKKRSRIKGSKVVDTSGDNWYEPFALALGINGEDFGPLQTTIFNDSNEIILVEGESDKEYFELLRSDEHEKSKLDFNGEIYAYGGADNLKNNVLVKFIKNRYSKFIVTIDIDRYDSLKKSLESVGITDNVNLVKIGLNQPGKKCIEGLLPAEVLKKVYSENPDTVQAAMANNKDKKSAQNKLKSLLLEEFKKEAKVGEEFYGEFYKVAKKLNKLINKE